MLMAVAMSVLTSFATFGPYTFAKATLPAASENKDKYGGTQSRTASSFSLAVATAARHASWTCDRNVMDGVLLRDVSAWSAIITTSMHRDSDSSAEALEESWN